jgi:hypothetical protein
MTTATATESTAREDLVPKTFVRLFAHAMRFHG